MPDMSQSMLTKSVMRQDSSCPIYYWLILQIFFYINAFVVAYHTVVLLLLFVCFFAKHDTTLVGASLWVQLLVPLTGRTA